MVWASASTITAGFTKESGRMTVDMEMAMRSIPTKIPTKVNSETIGLMEQELTLGRTERLIKANFRMGTSVERARGLALVAIITKDSGKTANATGMVFINGKTAINTRATGTSLSATATAPMSSPTAISMLELINSENHMDLGSTSGIMEIFTLEISSKVLNTAKVNGRKNSTPTTQKLPPTHMLETTPMIKSTARAFSNGHQEMNIKEAMTTTKDLATVRWPGRMAPSTKDSGAMASKMELASCFSLTE